MTQRRPLFSIPLVRELAMVLLVKLVIIFVLKHAYFSEPVDMTDAESVISRQLGILPENASATPLYSDSLLLKSETEL